MQSKRLSLIPLNLTLGLFLVCPVWAQNVILDTDTGGITPADLVDTLLGPDSAAVVSNISVVGNPECLGIFSGGDGLGLGVLGFDEGVMLSSGRVLDSQGPNVSDNTTTGFGTPGDPDLDTLTTSATFDACILEFDFECGSIDVASFEFAFSSEEYNEFVNSAFNNVFGFFLNGANIAMIPGSAGVPVAINNLNCDNPFNPLSPTTPNPPFCDQFINNDLSDGGGAVNIEADGISTVIGVQGNLLPGRCEKMGRRKLYSTNYFAIIRHVG